MTALSGVCAWAEDVPATRLAASILDAQAGLGPHGRNLVAFAAGAFGSRAYRLSADEKADPRPLVSEPLVFVADVRIDNRDELASALGLARAADLDDSRLLFESYRRWGLGLADRVLGNYAAAIWNEAGRELTLLRDPSGEKPLHYHFTPERVAFATLGSALAAMPDVGAHVDRQFLAQFLADLPRRGDRSYLEGVRRVRPGHAVVISRAGAVERDLWSMPTRELRLSTDSDYADAFREQLDRAVGVRLRSAGPQVGAHLSGGLDSSAVATTAARLLHPQGGRVVAFTSAPREDFPGLAVRGRVADESELARAVARAHPNIVHAIVRTGDRSPFALLARDRDRFDEPIGLPCNQMWWSAIHDAARDRGLSVLLTGEGGNFALSAGMVATLSEFVRRGRPLAWARHARSLLGTGPRVRGLLFASLGPWLPRAAWSWLDRRVHGSGVGAGGRAFLRAEYRDRIDAAAAARSRPRRSEYADRWAVMRASDPGNFRKGVLAGWGLEERDPTTDKRLLEFCFSLPPEQLVGNGLTRRLARTALADRVPAEVLLGPRGYQSADWFERVTPAGIRAAVDQLRAGQPDAGGVVDLDKVLALGRDWPEGGWDNTTLIQSHRLGLLRALSAAQFAAAVEDRARGRGAAGTPPLAETGAAG